MKSTLAITVMCSVLTAASIEVAALNRPAQNDHAPVVQVQVTSPSSSQLLTDVLATPAAIPRGPRDMLADYEVEMNNISHRLSAELGAISQAVSNGQATREQGEYLSRERYQVAMMQFQVLSTWHNILENDLAQVSATQPVATSAVGESIVLPLPFSSLQLNASLARYLELSSSQIDAITALMASQRRDLQPLMTQLESTRQRLSAAAQKGNPRKDEVQSLALTQARLLTKVIAANSHLQIKISWLLNSEQRRKLEELNRKYDLAMLNGE